MAGGSHLDEPIWDGNGGTLDPQKATQRDLIVALHVKMDNVVAPKLGDLEDRLRKQEDGHLTRGQEKAILDLLQSNNDENRERRNLKFPLWGFLVSVAMLAAVTLETLTYAGVKL